MMNLTKPVVISNKPRIPRQNIKEALNEADDDDDGFDIGRVRN